MPFNIMQLHFPGGELIK